MDTPTSIAQREMDRLIAEAYERGYNEANPTPYPEADILRERERIIADIRKIDKPRATPKGRFLCSFHVDREAVIRIVNGQQENTDGLRTAVWLDEDRLARAFNNTLVMPGQHDPVTMLDWAAVAKAYREDTE